MCLEISIGYRQKILVTKVRGKIFSGKATIILLCSRFLPVASVVSGVASESALPDSITASGTLSDISTNQVAKACDAGVWMGF